MAPTTHTTAQPSSLAGASPGPGQTTGCSVLDSTTIECLSAVADRNRMQVLMLLGEHERLCVGEIAKHFRISRPAISHHLRVLRNAGIVSCEKVGKEMYYAVEVGVLVARLRALADSLEQCCPQKTETSNQKE